MRPLTAVFVLAFVLRAGPVVYLEWQEPGWHARNIENLEFYFDDVGRSLIVGAGFVHSMNPRPGCPYSFQPGTPFDFEPPLYAFWIGLVYFAFGPNILVAKILQCVMDASVCFLLFLLGRRVTHDRTISLLAALLYAVYPLTIHICQHLYYQIPLNLAIIWLILCLMARRTWKNGLWTGLALGVSALAKPVTLPLIGLIPVVAALESVGRRLSPRGCLIWCLCFLGASLATLAPWTLRNYHVFGGFVPVQRGAGYPMLQGSTDEYLDTDCDTLREDSSSYMKVRRDQLIQASVNNHLQHLKEEPLDYLRFLAKKSVLTWYNTEGKSRNRLALLIQLPFISLAIIGLICAPKLWVTNGNWYVPAMILYICAVQVALLPLVRYTLAAMPLVMLIGAVGGTGLYHRAIAAKRRSGPTWREDECGEGLETE